VEEGRERSGFIAFTYEVRIQRPRTEVSITSRSLLSNAFVEGLLSARYSQNSIVPSFATAIPLNLYQGRPAIVANCPSIVYVDWFATTLILGDSHRDLIHSDIAFFFPSGKPPCT